MVKKRDRERQIKDIKRRRRKRETDQTTMPLRRSKGKSLSTFSSTACIVVLGMHGGGTSLVASILDALGVNMHYNPRARVKHYLNYEDTEFVKLNGKIMRSCGANWRKVPDHECITKSAEKFRRDIERTIEQRSDSPLWGYKDPRSAVTVHIIHPYLPNPRYIYVTRRKSDVVSSIMSRGGPTRPESDWLHLATVYYQRIERFLKRTKPKPVSLTVSFERLTDKQQCEAEVIRIAEFVGARRSLIKKAVARVKFK